MVLEAVADLHSNILDTRPGLTFFIFMQFLGQFWPNIRLALPLGLALLLEILDPPLERIIGLIDSKMYRFTLYFMGPIILLASYKA